MYENARKNDVIAREFGGACPQCGARYPQITVREVKEESAGIVRRRHSRKIELKCLNCDRPYNSWSVKIPQYEYYETLSRYGFSTPHRSYW